MKLSKKQYMALVAVSMVAMEELVRTQILGPEGTAILAALLLGVKAYLTPPSK